MGQSGSKLRITEYSLKNFQFALGFNDHRVFLLKGMGFEPHLGIAVLTDSLAQIDAVISRPSHLTHFCFASSGQITPKELANYGEVARQYRYPEEISRQVYESLVTELPLQELTEFIDDAVMLLPKDSYLYRRTSVSEAANRTYHFGIEVYDGAQFHAIGGKNDDMLRNLAKQVAEHDVPLLAKGNDVVIPNVEVILFMGLRDLKSEKGFIRVPASCDEVQMFKQFYAGYGGR